MILHHYRLWSRWTGPPQAQAPPEPSSEGAHPQPQGQTGVLPQCRSPWINARRNKFTFFTALAIVLGRLIYFVSFQSGYLPKLQLIPQHCNYC